MYVTAPGRLAHWSLPLKPFKIYNDQFASYLPKDEALIFEKMMKITYISIKAFLVSFCHVGNI
jgi:hypothetical protein